MPEDFKLGGTVTPEGVIDNPDVTKAMASMNGGSKMLLEEARKQATNLELAKEVYKRFESDTTKRELEEAYRQSEIEKEAILELIQDIQDSGAAKLSVLRGVNVLESAQGRAGKTLNPPPTPKTFFERTGIEEPGFNQSHLRGDVRAARQMVQSGEPMKRDDPIIKNLAEQKDNLLNFQKELWQKFTELKAEGSKESMETADEISAQISSTGNLRTEITNLLESFSSKQASGLNKVLTFVSSTVAALGVGQAISRFALSEPYRYGTQAQLGIISQQGQMGAAIGGAMGEVEARNYELNQMGLNTSMGVAALGVNTMMSGKNMGGGIAMSVIGGIGTALAASGAFDDIIKSVVPGVRGDEAIMVQSLAKQFSDPSRLVQEFQNSRVGLYALGGRASDEYGIQTEGDRVGFGNNALNVAFGGSEGVLRSLGYNRESLGVLASKTAMGLRGTPEELGRYATGAAEIGGAYGMGEDAVLSVMQSAQRAGSSDALGSYQRMSGTFADSSGDVSAYAANVLVPALMQVTEGMAIRNLARSTEELEQEVTTFGHTVLSRNDTRLGELAAVNPQIIGTILSGLQGAASLGASNPAIAALDLSLGSSMADIFRGTGSVADNRLQYVLQQGGFAGQEFGGVEDFLGSSNGISVLRVMQELFPGMDPQALIAVAELGMQGSLFDSEGKATDKYKEIIQDYSESTPGALAEKMSQQVDEFLHTSSGLMDELKALQEAITGYMTRNDFSEGLKSFLESATSRLDGTGGDALQHDLQEAMTVIMDAQERGEVSDLVSSDYAKIVRDSMGETDYARLVASFIDNPDLETQFMEMLPSMVSKTGSGYIDYSNDAVMGSYDRIGGLVGNMMGSDFLTGHSSGGYTGSGGRHSVAGTVHAGEYVISSDKVSGNRQLLDRIQSGEVISETSSGNTTFLTIKIHGMTQDDIVNTSKRVTEEYIVRNRLNYT